MYAFDPPCDMLESFDAFTADCARVAFAYWVRSAFVRARKAAPAGTTQVVPIDRPPQPQYRPRERKSRESRFAIARKFELVAQSAHGGERASLWVAAARRA
jgi:hypothetical protein